MLFCQLKNQLQKQPGIWKARDCRHFSKKKWRNWKGIEKAQKRNFSFISNIVMNIIIIIIIVIVIIIIVIIIIIIIIIVIISFIFLIILEMTANESAFFNRGLRGEQAYAKQAVSPCPAVGVFIQDGFNFPFCKVMLRGNQLSSFQPSLCTGSFLTMFFQSFDKLRLAVLHIDNLQRRSMTYVWKCKRTYSGVAWRMCGHAREPSSMTYVWKPKRTYSGVAWRMCRSARELTAA